MLHITNGDAAAELIRAANIGGEVVPWHDVLHEGACPAGLSLDEMSEVRAEFIARCGWGELDAVRAEFQERDATIGGYGEHDELVLWFEHDLYDQLQLIQILHWMHESASVPELIETRLSLISIDSHPDVEDFHGLGQLTPDAMRELFLARRSLDTAQFDLGGAAWEAFCSSDPRDVVAMLDEDTSALPFLDAAFMRHLEQFPAAENGLSRTENQILHALDLTGGASDARRLFDASQEMEEARFLGDRVFYDLYLKPLAGGAHPLIVTEEELEVRDELTMMNGEVTLTSMGKKVLEGAEHNLSLNPIDVWRGGAHLHESETIWMWDAATLNLVRW